jgi:hypothetical protein
VVCLKDARELKPTGIKDQISDYILKILEMDFTWVNVPFWQKALAFFN